MTKVMIDGRCFEMSYVADFMADDIREEIVNEGKIFDDEQGFLDEYKKRHFKRFKQPFDFYKINEEA